MSKVKARYRVRLEHENDEGNLDTYVFNCRSVTARQLREVSDAQGDDDVFLSEMLAVAVSSASRNDQPIEDLADLPLEITEAVLDKHPSFRGMRRRQGGK